MDVQAIVTGADPARLGAAEMSLGQDPRGPKQLSAEEIEMICESSPEVTKARGDLDIYIQEIEKQYGRRSKAPLVAQKKLRHFQDKLTYRINLIKKRELSRKQSEYHRNQNDRDIESLLQGTEPKVDMPHPVVPEMVLDLLLDDDIDGKLMISLLQAIEINCSRKRKIKCSRKNAATKLPATTTPEPSKDPGPKTQKRAASKHDLRLTKEKRRATSNPSSSDRQLRSGNAPSRDTHPPTSDFPNTRGLAATKEN